MQEEKSTALYQEEIYSSPEAINNDEYIIGIYRMETDNKDLLKMAGSIAVEQSTGTWHPLPIEEKSSRGRHIGKVLGVYDLSDKMNQAGGTRTVLAQIALPVINTGPDISELLLTIFGNISSLGKLRLLDVVIPHSYTRGFQGPKYGSEGVRKILGVYDRPLHMVKLEKIHLDVNQADIIKDNRIYEIGNSSVLYQEIRKTNYLLEQECQKGHKYLYAVNITGKVDEMKETAKHAIQEGADCLVVNAWTAGFGALKMLADDPDIQVPILAEGSFAGCYFVTPDRGMSTQVIFGRLTRLAGADMVEYPSAYSRIAISREAYLKTAIKLQTPFYHIRKAFPVLAVSLSKDDCAIVETELGKDYVYAEDSDFLV